MGSVAALWFALTSLTAAPPAGVRFEAPAGWSRSDPGGVITLTPPGLASGERCTLELFPGEEAADARSWFDRSWAGVKQGYREPEETPVAAARNSAGNDTLIVGGSMANANGAFVYLMFFAAFQGSRAQPVLLTASSSARYAQASQAVQPMFQNLAVLPAEKLPPASKTSFVTRLKPYLASPPAAAVPAPAAPQPGPAAPAGAGGGSVVGTWSQNGSSAGGYYNTSTGIWTAANGQSDSWVFEANGKFTHSNLMQNKAYGCTNEIFVWATGRYSAEGGRLTLRETESTSKYTYGCNHSKDHDNKRPLEVKTASFRIEQDETGQSIFLTFPPDPEYRFQKMNR